MADSLKPCPFCGAESGVNYGVGGTIAYVRCEGCGVYSPHFSKKQEAIEFWNARAERTCTMEEDIWIPCEEDGCKRLSTPRWWCSECENDSIGARPYYCPECGAKVIG